MLDGARSDPTVTRTSRSIVGARSNGADGAAARNWLIDNQLARRNLTREQRDYLIGKRYVAVRKDPGRHAAAERTAPSE